MDGTRAAGGLSRHTGREHWGWRETRAVINSVALRPLYEDNRTCFSA